MSAARLRPDSGEAILGYLPADGGSGVWDYSDDRPAQFDSLNDVTSAALSRGGRLLVHQRTGPLNARPGDYPLLWHSELYVLPLDRRAERRQLLELFDEVGGHLTDREGGINWLSRLQWLDEERFVAEAGHQSVVPQSPVARLGLLTGSILRDTTVVNLVDNLAGVDDWSVTNDGELLLQSGLSLWLRPAGSGSRLLLATLPSGESRSILASRCDRDWCWAVAQDGPAADLVWEIWRIGRNSGEQNISRTLAPAAGARVLLPPSGEWIVVIVEGIPFRIDGILAEP